MKLTKEMLKRVRKQEGLKQALWVYLKIKVFKIKEGAEFHGASKVCKCILFPVKAYKWSHGGKDKWDD